MASFFCHGFGGTKQVRLERIVRPVCLLCMSDMAFASAPRARNPTALAGLT